MPSNARNLANLLGSGETQISAAKLGNDVAPGTEDYSSVDSLGVGTTIGETAFVQGSNRMYIWNGSGWYNIALINTSPTWDSGGQPSGSYVLDADSPQDATVITLAALDPEGLPISYSYITSGSMDSMATISQDSSVFTITPKTVAQVGEGIELTGSVTFRASDGVNILPHVSSFTLSFVTFIENSRYTTLLATATGTSDNNNITDSSTNNHTITVNGDAQAAVFSPYHDSYSAYMNGGDLYYLSSSADWNLGSSWTIEGWFYPTAQPTETCRLFMFGTNGGSAAMGIGLNSDMTWGGGGAFPNGAMFNLPQGYLNQWQHVAWVRDGNSNTGTIYVNGVASAGSYSGPAVQAAGNVDLKIGYDTVGTVAYQYRGYIADLRITKSAVYTSNFTPATERLTSSDVLTDTKLLTFNRAYLKDESASNHNISISAGNPRFVTFPPFDKLEYNVTDNGGSVYFGASSSYLYAPTGEVALGSGDFTAEVWVYPNSVQSSGTIIDWRSAGNAFANIPTLSLTNVLTMEWRHNAGASALISSSSNLTSNAWNHCVIERSGTTITMYLNGKSVGSTTNNSDDLTVQRFRINDSQGLYAIFGYFSDARITIGSAVYGSEFTPPSAPLSSTGSTLHVKGTDASIIDKSQNANLKLVGNTTGSTTEVKFADTKSIYFDGASDYIITTQQELGTGDFTIEGWHYLLTRANTRNGIFGNYSSYSAGSLAMFAGHSSATTTAYQVAYNGASFPASVIQGGTIVYNQWVHFAVVRNSGTMSLYIDGTSVDSISATASLNGVGSNFIVGAPSDNLADGMQGYLQDFRITKGLARYTSNFTPPTAPLKG